MSDSHKGRPRRLPHQFGHVLDLLAPSEEAVLIGTAILVGVGTGLAQIVFHFLIDAVHRFSYEVIPGVTTHLEKSYVVIIPAVGGLLVGLLTYNFAREAKGHGVPEVMAAIALRGGRIRPIVAVIKAIASSITIGSGGSAGREGPIVQIGSALGSSLGQYLNLSDERIRNLVACGAAGGIAATFNTPIAGVIFALEIILGAFSVRYFSTVVISAVVASVISRSVFGENPVFVLPVEYGVRTVWEFAFYPLLGILAGVLGLGYVRLLYWTEDVFDGWKAVPEWVKPAIGGAVLGMLALAYPVITGITWNNVPQIFSGGYSIIDSTLANSFTLEVVITLMILKLVATSLTLGSGGSGGVFAPSLFMGAMLGAAFELIIKTFVPSVPAPAGAYAIVGMGAVFAASTHAPITAVLIMIELTNDNRIILPLMLTVIVATLLARILLKNQSIYTMKLIRRGIRLQGGRDVDIMQGVTVSEAITSNLHTIPISMTLAELSQLFDNSHHHGFPVLDAEGKLWGIVTVTDLDRAIDRDLPRSTSLDQIATPRAKLLVAFPDESIGDALVRMGARGLGRMPVVSRDNPDDLIGIIRRADIISAYHIALARRADIHSRARTLLANDTQGMEFTEVTLPENSPIVGKMVSEVATSLPEECILISIQRQGRVLIPHGSTLFQTGDHITAFTRTDTAENLRTCLLTAPVTPEVVQV